MGTSRFTSSPGATWLAHDSLEVAQLLLQAVSCTKLWLGLRNTKLSTGTSVPAQLTKLFGGGVEQSSPDQWSKQVQ